MSFLLRALLVAILAYCAYGAMLFFTQRGMTFIGAGFPAPNMPGLPPTAERVFLTLPFGRVEAVFLRSPAAGVPAPTIVFAHGNAEFIAYNVDEFAPWVELGFNVLLIEYPGYAGSAGSPSKDTLDASWLAGWDWLMQRKDVDSRRIVAMGRSVGSGPTASLAAAHPVAAVVLQSAFSSTTQFAHERWLPGFLVRDRWDNLAALRSYAGPVFASQGKHDEVIPVRHGERISELRNVEFVWQDCGHNDCPLFSDDYRAQVMAFLARHGISPVPGFSP